MLLLGSKAPGRTVEQHDFFFGIAETVKDLVPQIRAFWPEAGEKLHVDGWREVNVVENYAVHIIHREEHNPETSAKRLFFINLGGYTPGKLEEQHYTLLTVQDDKAAALQYAKSTHFFRHNHFESAHSHVDDKYGIDVDELYAIEEILPPAQKALYRVLLVPSAETKADELHLGYFKLNSF